MSLKPQVSTSDHQQGSKTAIFEIVEFGDYQCPYCGAAHPVMKQLMLAFGDHIRFIFRNFPLTEIHAFAWTAALAAEAAAQQGKFWEMHDLLYENQQGLSAQLPRVLARKLKLDPEQFERDIAAARTSARVEGDFESGMRSGVNGTPTFFVNGSKFNGGAEELFEMVRRNRG